MRSEPPVASPPTSRTASVGGERDRSAKDELTQVGLSVECLLTVDSPIDREIDHCLSGSMRETVRHVT